MTPISVLMMKSISKALKKHLRSKAPNILNNHVMNRYNVEYVMMTKSLKRIPSLYHVNVKDQWDLFILIVSSNGSILRRLRRNQLIRILGHSIGRDSDVRFASKCILITSKWVNKYIRLWTLKMKLHN